MLVERVQSASLPQPGKSKINVIVHEPVHVVVLKRARHVSVVFWARVCPVSPSRSIGEALMFVAVGL